MRIETHEIPGPAGRLEALLTVPQEGTPSRAAIMCHPHPLFGGTLHNKVVFHVSRALAGLGWPVLRFNFRGVGKSGGRLNQEAGMAGLLDDAADDLRAATGWMAQKYPNVPMCAGGFSFGSKTMLRVAENEPRFERLLAVGTPVGDPDFSAVFNLVTHLHQPKLFIAGANDEYAPTETVQRMFEAAAEPKRLIVIPDSGHFFDGHLDELRRAAIAIAELGI